MPNSADDPEAIIRDLIAQEMAKITNEGKKRPALVPTNKAPNDEQLNEMKEWIHSLPQDGVLLLQKMEFDFVNSNAFKSNMAGLSDAVSSSMSDEDESSEILMQILMQQAPLPTPIHRRAVPYESASCTIFGASDGRDDVERVRRDRFRRPHLFQLVECMSGGDGDTLAALDAKAGPSSSINIRPGRRKRKSQKRQQHFGNSGTRRRKFDIVAKKCVTTWGDILSLGQTDEQRFADGIILAGAVLSSDLEPDKSMHGDAGGSAAFLRRRCQLHLPSQKNSKKDILCLLHIASRGRFLSMSSDHVPKECGFSSFCAPWLDPTAEWFSLPTFLASRFEAALWSSYRRKKEADQVSSLRRASFLPKQFNQDIRHALYSSICQAFAGFLRKEETSAGRLRDSRVWQLLISSFCLPSWTDYSISLHQENEIHGLDYEEIFLIPLIEAGSALDEFKCLVGENLKEAMVRKSEKELLDMIQSCGQENNAEGERFSKSSSQKRAKKKKKGSKKQLKGPILQRIDETSSVQAITKSVFEDELLDDSLIVGKHGVLAALPSKERNQKVIVILQVINDVLDRVFDDVGLGGLEDEKWVGVGGARGKRPFSEKKETQAIELDPNLVYKSDLPNHPVAPIIQNRGQTKISPSPSISISQARKEGEAFSSTSMLSLGSNPYYRPPSPHDHAFSFIENTQNQSVVGSNYEYGSIFQDGAPPIGMSLNLSSTFDSWSGAHRYQSRNRSLFAGFFRNDGKEHGTDDILMAASTAASIASSLPTEDEDDDYSDGHLSRIVDDCRYSPVVHVSDVETNPNLEREKKGKVKENSTERVLAKHQMYDHEESPLVSHVHAAEIIPDEMKQIDLEVENPLDAAIPLSDDSAGTTPTPPPARSDHFQSPRSHYDLDESPAPSEPPTPPPQLSPIQVSLAELGKLVRRKTSEELRRNFDLNGLPAMAGSVPGSPKLDSSSRNWSRYDLRLENIRQRGGSHHDLDQVMNYKNAVEKSLTKAASTCSHELRSDTSADTRLTDRHKMTTDFNRLTLSIPSVDRVHINSCARSETALDDLEESSHMKVTQAPPHDESDDFTAISEGTIEVSSVQTHREIEELTHLREERNAFRDLCLTLGAEVARLKNTVAALQQGQNSTYAHPKEMGYSIPAHNAPNAMAPDFPPSFFPRGSNRTFAAMSDAGLDAAISEDGTENQGADNSGIRKLSGDHPTQVIQFRRPSTTGVNKAESDVSVEYPHGCQSSVAVSALISSVHRDPLGGVPSNGLQSRLSNDINSYIKSISSQLKRLEGQRLTATKRLTRLVTALWPRAQVKLYGSHLSNLCLPSSDLDFVICLPSVHRTDIAVAPGVLEGRNAINETNQKMLARKLKGESWIGELSSHIMIHIIRIMYRTSRFSTLPLTPSDFALFHHPCFLSPVHRSKIN